MLRTIPGIGNVLGLTIMLEVKDIARFSKVGDYSSYGRCVERKRISNGKKKDENNKKMAISIWPGLMCKLPSFPEDIVSKRKAFIRAKKRKRNLLLRSKH